jgi:TolA-binding protein
VEHIEKSHLQIDLKVQSDWQRFYTELKYIVSTGVALAGAAVVVNQEITKVKIKGVVVRVDCLEEKLEQIEKNMGQRVDRLEEKLDNMEKRMDEKFDRMEQKMDKVLIQQFVPNSWPWSNGRR